MRFQRIVALVPVIAVATVLLVGCATHNAPPPVTPTAVQSAVAPTPEFVPPVAVPAEVSQAIEVVHGVCQPAVHMMGDEKYSYLTVSTRLMLAAAGFEFSGNGSNAGTNEVWERWDIKGYDCLGLRYLGTKPSNLTPERVTIGSGQSSIKNGMQCFAGPAATEESVYTLVLALAKAIKSVQSGAFHGSQLVTVQYKGNSYMLDCGFAV